MVAWHRKPGAGRRLRLAGVALVAVAGLAAVGLHALVSGAPHDATGFDYVVALVVLGSGLAGIALAVEGAHLFDPVPLPPRLAAHRPPCGRPPGGRAAAPTDTLAETGSMRFRLAAFPF